MNPEVLIIGGGVIGLGIARELHKRGVRDIAIVDRGPLGAEASWAAAGMLAPNIETSATEEFHRFGVNALSMYPGFAADLADETGIDVELDRSGTLSLAFSETEESDLAESYEKHRSRGVEVERLAASKIREIEPAISTAARAGLLFPNDWQVENRKLLAALIRYSRTNEITIIEGTEVAGLVTKGARVTGASTSKGELRSDITVVATGAWTSFIKIGGMPMPFHVKPIRGQMIAFETPLRAIRRVVYSPRGYVVPRADGRVLVGATVEDAGFEKMTTPDGIDDLTAAAYEIEPGLKKYPVTSAWAGLRPFAADGLPVIGSLPGYENAFVATAHYRNGILLAPLTAKIVAEKIVDDGSPEFFDSFTPERFSLASNAIAQ